MPTLVKEKPLVRTTYDDMEAYIQLAVPADDEEYTLPFLMQALTDKGINTGIDQQMLSDLIKDGIYGQEVRIASGTAPVDGVDGYYDYKFDTNFDGKPKILPDGSVDYWSVHSIEAVVKDQVIAVYHPAVEGKDGITVKGKILSAKRGREQLPLKGKGFERMTDGVTYQAAMDGKIEMQNDRIVVLTVHEIAGNAELATGNIDFRGDVVIHGGVENGLKIKATGSITIDGVVESCELEAGKDIILRSGMLGGNKASVRTKGNITAKFFEFTTIECEGNIQANVLMECQVRCQGKVILNGSHGKIIGGDVRAIKGIEVTTLGNDAEKRTIVSVGAGIEVYSKLRMLEKKIQETQENLEKIEGGLKMFDTMERERGVSYANDPRRMALLRVKIKDMAELANDQAEEKKLRRLADNSRGACVSVLREVYPGVIVNIDEMKFMLKNIGKSIEFFKLPDKIATRPYYKDVE